MLNAHSCFDINFEEYINVYIKTIYWTEFLDDEFTCTATINGFVRTCFEDLNLFLIFENCLQIFTLLNISEIKSFNIHTQPGTICMGMGFYDLINWEL